MAEEVTGVIELIGEEGPFERKDKSGTYFRKNIKLESGEEFTAYKNDKTDALNEGDTVKVTFQKGKAKNGREFTTVLSISPTSKTTTPIATRAKAPSEPVVKKPVNVAKSAAPADKNGMRTGMIANKTVDLAMRNASPDSSVSLADLKAAADLVIATVEHIEANS